MYLHIDSPIRYQALTGNININGIVVLSPDLEAKVHGDWPEIGLLAFWKRRLALDCVKFADGMVK
jgi:hypothetical protein